MLVRRVACPDLYGSPAKVSVAWLDPGMIVGHVPLIVGRNWADGLSPPPPLLDPDPLELALASVMSPEPLDPPELPPDPEPLPDPSRRPIRSRRSTRSYRSDVSLEPELPLGPRAVQGAPGAGAGRRSFPEAPGSVDDEPQLAVSTKPVTATPKASVQRMASSVAAIGAALRAARALELKPVCDHHSTQLTNNSQSSICIIRLRRSGTVCVSDLGDSAAVKLRGSARNCGGAG